MKYFSSILSIFLIIYSLNNHTQALEREPTPHKSNSNSSVLQTKTQNERIIFGVETMEGIFPWHVILRKNSTDKLLCGGSLISDKWVLTCAHCLYNRDSVFLVFGEIHLSSSGANMTCSKFYIHPEYDHGRLINDMALIELPAPVTITVNIYPIKLVTATDAANHDFLGNEAIICGFGVTTDAETAFSEDLLFTVVEPVNNTICEEAYREPMEETIICTRGYENTRRSPCLGDSGGALIWQNDMSEIVQIGIYSFSKKLNCSRYPSGYTRVSSYLDYIHNITGI